MEAKVNAKCATAAKAATRAMSSMAAQTTSRMYIGLQTVTKFFSLKESSFDA
jgi:hypothetical protein